MKKLVEGILDFRRHVWPAYRRTFERLADRQAPPVLFITCSDSRVVPHLVTQSDPGDLFKVRTIGNLVPHSEGQHDAHSVPAALEFAVLVLGVSDIILCGHSNCGAMKALLSGDVPKEAKHLRGWLKFGDGALQRYCSAPEVDHSLPDHDQLAEANILEQLANLRSYSYIAEREAAGTLRLHGWFFDVGKAAIHAWEPELAQFVEIDEEEGDRIIRHLEDAERQRATTLTTVSQLMAAATPTPKSAA
jgi:carbonic anhydrase